MADSVGGTFCDCFADMIITKTVGFIPVAARVFCRFSRAYFRSWLLFGWWLGTPVYSEFRYACPFILSMPLILGATVFGFGKTEDKHSA